jgi:hypothetical protein
MQNLGKLRGSGRDGVDSDGWSAGTGMDQPYFFGFCKKATVAAI